MAKRRTLTTPSPEELAAIEAEVEVGSPRRSVAPIAQVAAEAARAADGATAEVRAERARNAADAAKLREAEEGGLLLTRIAIDAINAEAIVRDRTDLDEDEMLELRLSISKNGVRLPLEVFELPNPEGEVRYGLLSGFRRLVACRTLVEEYGREEFRSVPCFVRAPSGVDAAYAAMVEENEVRANLTPFERGRIAVIAAGQGAFANVYAAVDALFESASKAKRSKIRSFALIFEELGDLLTFPDDLSEARGLKVAAALQAGGQAALREVLSGDPPENKEEEWQLLEYAMDGIEAKAPPKAKGGRPKKAPAGNVLATSSGHTIRTERQGGSIVLKIEGPHLHSDLVDSLADRVRDLLEKP